MGGINENIEVKDGQEKYDVKLSIHEWKHYPEYKDSGVEWIGEIPKNWEIKRLRRLLVDKLKYGQMKAQNLKIKNFPDISELQTLMKKVS